jgi:glycosyltransferase involved in cell wall biosynthesis
MRILFITPRIPYPPFRGDKIRVSGFIKYLSRKHEIGLVSLIQNAGEEKHAEALSEWCSYIHLTHLPVWKSLINSLLALPGRLPIQVAYYRSNIFHQTIREALTAFKPDIIYSHLIRSAPFTAGISDVPRVLDMTDAVSLYLKRFSEQEHNPLKRAFLKLELGRIERYESMASKFDRTLVCSDMDRDIILKHAPAAHVEILNNAVDMDCFTRRSDVTAEPGRIIFTGNMTYFPNIDAAHWLAKEIFPLIKERVPFARLYLVGQNPPPGVRALASEDIVVTGFVPDISIEYQKSVVAVSPVRFGSGTLTKVVEPLALGVPVVSTSIGTHIFKAEPGIKLNIADDAGTFADKVAAFLQNPAMDRDEMMSSAARVCERFSMKGIAKELERHFELAINHFETCACPDNTEAQL